MKYNILVNKDNRLDKNYIPKNLVISNKRETKHVNNNYKNLIVKKVLKDFNKMNKQALKQGYDLGIDSGYRPYEYQQELVIYWVNKKGNEAYNTVALPGTSEHQTGLAIDLCCYRNNEYIIIEDDKHEEIKWVIDNCYKYGFILRYPFDKVDITKYSYEPWHLRYVGSKTSKLLNENNWCLEEYYKYKY